MFNSDKHGLLLKVRIHTQIFSMNLGLKFHHFLSWEKTAFLSGIKITHKNLKKNLLGLIGKCLANFIINKNNVSYITW